MAQDIYILLACDEQADRTTMNLQGATTDKDMLEAMIAAKIKDGEMGYGGFREELALQHFQQDFNNEKVDYEKLNYGCVRIYEDMQIWDSISMEQLPEAADTYEELTTAKAKQCMENMGLNQRSLLYSMVDLHSECGCDRIYLPGICSEESLKTSKRFLDLMSGRKETDLFVEVSCYKIGRMDKNDDVELCTEQELAIINKIEIPFEYEITLYLSDEFCLTYEPEEMEER